MKTTIIKQYKTPVSNYPERSLGSAEIRKRIISPKAQFFGEGVRGRLFYRFGEPTSITELRIDGETWMTDEPNYVDSLQSFVTRAHGRVLVAGMGLGIVLHQLYANEEVTTIDVVERNPDVIGLVGPLLPHDSRGSVHEADFYDWCDRMGRAGYSPDTIIWDLAVASPDKGLTEGREITYVHVLMAGKYFGHKRWDQNLRDWVSVPGRNPDMKVFVHGLDRDPVGEEFVKTNEFKRAKEAIYGSKR